MTTKQKFGQFYTTNYQYILQNLCIPDNVENIVEPFAGNCDLLQFITDKNKYNIECYDIDPKNDNTIMQDTIENPPNYDNKFILTNPPYLARNKSKDKKLFDKYDVNDLYKCFIINLISSKPLGGILIIPLNFWSSIRKSDIQLREQFLNNFDILHINIFEEQVFDDTSYTICSFQFERKSGKDKMINIGIYPIKGHINVLLNNDNNYTIGGEIYNLPQNKKIKIDRLTRLNKSKKNCITNILVKCIDDNSQKKINLSITSDEDRYIDDTDNLSARSYATLVINPPINLDKQKELVDKFNEFINEKRDKYNSLFLTNYRESKDIARKRISFKLVYEIVNYLLNSANHS
jgi:hypothetical protein